MPSKPYLKRSNHGNWQRRFWLPAGALFLATLTVVLGIANMHMHSRKKEFLAQVSNLQAQKEGLQKRNGQLQQGIENSDDPRYIEKVAREELDLQQPGEVTVSFVFPSPTPSFVANTQITVQGWLGSLWASLTGKK